MMRSGSLLLHLFVLSALSAAVYRQHISYSTASTDEMSLARFRIDPQMYLPNGFNVSSFPLNISLLKFLLVKPCLSLKSYWYYS